MTELSINEQKTSRVRSWVKDRILQTLDYDTGFWLKAAMGLWLAAGIAVMITGLGNPTGLGTIPDILIFFFAHQIVFGLAVPLLAVTASFLQLPVPRLFTGSLLYTEGLVFFILEGDNLGTWFSLVTAMVYTAAGLILGLILATLTHHQLNAATRVKISLLLLGLPLLSFTLIGSDNEYEVQPTFAEGDPAEPLQIEDPAEPGKYRFHYFTYGSGRDRHRDEFASGVDLLSDTVDASAYIENWPWLREWFWGFDEKELPLNGRVWMPEGEGPFPLVILVHGNHSMEDFSDNGYGYLGELLASHGFITVSVDQNFFNYSSWSGIPKEDMKLRAWGLMHHLLQIQRFQEDPQTPFYQKVDLQNIALIGHSRGGQAVAMAADYTRWFDQDDSLEGMENMGIQAVVGLAPTDKRIDEKKASLNNIYYLVLHGARDADVNSFYGDHQFNRTYFDEDSERFKSAIYIAEANHSQFNTDWGTMDMSLPGGIFLNQRDTMEGSSQRQIARVFVTAFLEAALQGKKEYIDLFRDVRHGKEWLPNTQYVSRFQNGLYRPLADFDRLQDFDITVKTEGFTDWEIKEVKDRLKNNKGSEAAMLEWDDQGSYTAYVSESYRQDLRTESDAYLTFSVANLDMDLTDSDVPQENPQVEIEIETVAGETLHLPQDQMVPVVSPIQTQYAKISILDPIMKEGKYKEAVEPVFQTYAVPLDAFEEVDTEEDESKELDPQSITRITLHFTSGPGKVLLDDIGWLWPGSKS